MGGLILAGIGKGIADAGATVGNSMFRTIESDLAEQRAIHRQETLDELRHQRTIKDAAAAEIEAQRIGQERAAKQGDAAAGKIASIASRVQGDAPAMSQDEIKKLIEENPQHLDTYRKAGLVDKAMTPNEQRVQAATDRVQAAMNIGAHSTVIDAFQKQRKDTLEEIRIENQEKKEDRRHEMDVAREERRSKEFQALLPIRQQTADAATDRANRPAAAKPDSSDKPPTGIDLERNAKAAEKALALELGVPVKDVSEKVAQLRKKNQISASVQEKLDSYTGALSEWQNYKKNKPSASPSSDDNAGSSRPPLGSFRR